MEDSPTTPMASDLPFRNVATVWSLSCTGSVLLPTGGNELVSLLNAVAYQMFQVPAMLSGLNRSCVVAHAATALITHVDSNLLLDDQLVLGVDRDLNAVVQANTGVHRHRPAIGVGGADLLSPV